MRRSSHDIQIKHANPKRSSQTARAGRDSRWPPTDPCPEHPLNNGLIPNKFQRLGARPCGQALAEATKTQTPKQSEQKMNATNKSTNAKSWLPVCLQKLIVTFVAPFRSNGKANAAEIVRPKEQIAATATSPAKTDHHDEIHWCSHFRHGTFPKPRRFLTRGLSGTGTPFNVFQCTDPNCKEFVAAVSGPKGPWILFRGRNFRPRPESRPTPVLRVARAAAAVMLAVALVGCGRAYKTPLDSNDTLSTTSTVQIDGRHVEGGKVTKISADANSQRIAEFTTGKEALRRGTVRIPHSGVVDLRTDQATEEVLPFGAMIPVQSQLAYITGKWSGKAVALIAIAALAAAIAFRRFLAFRAVQPLIPLVTVIAVSAAIAYVGNSFAAPWIHKLQTQSKVSDAAQSQASGDLSVKGEWAQKFKVAEQDFTALISAPQNAHLIAFLAIFLISLPIVAVCISRLLRRLAPAAVLCSLLVLGAVSTVNAAPGGVYYDLAGLKEEQRIIQEAISEAQRNLDSSTRLFDANFSGAPERLVQAYFLSDLAAIRIEGEPDRIAQLKVSFGRSKSEEQKKLSGLYNSLREQIQAVQLDAAKLSQRVNTATNAPALLRIFQSRQADYRNQIRGGFSDPKIVLDECNRHVAAELAANAELTKKENDKRASEIAKLQAQVAELRRVRESTKTNSPLLKTIVVTNERVVEKLVPTPAPPPEVRFLTNTIFVEDKTNSPVQSASANSNAESSTNQPQAGAVAPIPEDNGPPPASTITAARHSKIALVAGVGGGAIVLCVISWLAYLSSFRGRPYLLSLAWDAGKPEEIELAAMEEALCLQAPPVREAVALVNGTANITIGWRGPVLRPGAHASVRVNDLPVSQKQKLFPGDCIVIEGEKSLQFNFLGCDPASAGQTVEV